MDGEAELPRNRLGERDLSREPARGLGPVQAEHADDPVEDDDRGGDDAARPEVEERLATAEARVLELRCRLDVGHVHRPPVAGGEVEAREPGRHVAHRPDSGRVPLGQDGHRLADLAEPDERARDVADRPRRLLDGDAERRVDVELGADAPADLGDQALAPERGPKRLVRARAAERQGSFAGQALHDVELGGGEAPVARPGDDDQDADDLALREQRHEGGALRPDGVGERTVDARRGDRVVDRDGHTLADDGHDGAAVRVQLELDAPPPRFVDAARDEPGRRAQLLVDLGQQERVRLEQRLHLVEERPGRLLRRLRLRERGREPRDRVGLAPALGGDLLGLAHAPPRRDEERPVVAAEEDDDAGDGDRRRAHDDEPGGLVREDVAARERQAGEQGRDGRHHGEEKPDPQSQAGGLPLPQERHAEEDRDEPVEARQDQERDGVQEHRLTVGAHRESSGDDRSRAARSLIQEGRLGVSPIPRSRKEKARRSGGKRGGPFQIAHRGLHGQGHTPRFASPSDATLTPRVASSNRPTGPSLKALRVRFTSCIGRRGPV